MGVKTSIIPGFWKHNPEASFKDEKKEKSYANSEPSTFHHIHPLTMEVLDEFYVHQLLDRIGYEKNFDELMKFTRHFVLTHYKILRIKREECTLPRLQRYGMNP